MPSFDVVSGGSITLGGYRSTNIEESLVHHIDHSFLADEPESWFRLLFKHEQWDISYSDYRRDAMVDEVHTEQVLFQYQNPWTIQMRWSKNAAEVLSGFQHAASKEPVLLEWTNMMANHWACHWLRKKLAPLAPSSLPTRTQGPTRHPKDATYTLCVALSNLGSGQEAYVEIDWFLPADIQLPTHAPSAWSPDTLNFMDMLPIGTVLLNEQGEVTHCNKWMKQKEPYLQKSVLPLPWELVFHEHLLHDIWSLYYTYQRASYCTPWLHHIETSMSFESGPYIVSLVPSNKGATMQLTPIAAAQIDELNLVRIDSVTHLYTREAWLDKLSHLTHQDGWLVLMGIDGFKQVNDSLGHQVGDQYLREVANRLCDAYPDALIGRWDGDEFMLWFNQSQQPDVRSIFKAPFHFEAEPFYGSAGVGLSRVYPPTFAQEQVQQLEWALHDAKAQGRGKMHIATADNSPIKDVRKQLFYIESRLRQAVALKQFCLLYQPIVRLSDKKIVGAEALIRWRHPELGVVAPQQFISVAEQNGTITPMTSWVLDHASTTAKPWALDEHFVLSINLSPSQFYDSTLVKEIQTLLEANNFPAQNLKLEITEGVMLGATEENKSILAQLQELGVTFAIDDFGTGNSSLSYLKDFPIQQLKIDKSYIHALHRPHHKMLTQSIIELSHNMGIFVVAEGVETQQQEDILLELGCDLVQGYKYGRPMAADQLAELLLRQQSH